MPIGCVFLPRGVIAAFDAAAWTGEYDFRHVFKTSIQRAAWANPAPCDGAGILT